jgi:hypothetical protein
VTVDLKFPMLIPEWFTPRSRLCAGAEPAPTHQIAAAMAKENSHDDAEAGDCIRTSRVRPETSADTSTTEGMTVLLRMTVRSFFPIPFLDEWT